MFRSTDLAQDLKLDILELKKELATARDDNQLLKVKIRKLQNEVSKRDRQIEILLDPRKSTFVRKVASEKGASMLINLRERYHKLEKILVEKDSLIKRLQNDLQTKKLYTAKSADNKHFSKQIEPNNKYNINIPYYEQDCESDSEKEEDTKLLEHGLKSISMCDIIRAKETPCYETTASHSSARSTSANRAASADRIQFEKHSNNAQKIKCINSDMKAQYEGLSREHLLSIIESLKNNQFRFSPRIRKGGSPESDLERNELLCDTPHQEIQHLQNYFMDMLTEVDHLKTTISTLQSQQNKTINLLKQKDSSITQLAKEIKTLKRPKSESTNTVKLKNSPSSSSHQWGYNKRSNSGKKMKAQGVTKTMVEIEKGTVDEEILDTCTYTETEELEPQQKEYGVQIIHTRTVSIQKFDNYQEGKCKENEAYLSLEPQNFKNEEETRRHKFNSLMENLLQKSNETKPPMSSLHEDSDLETEYI